MINALGSPQSLLLLGGTSEIGLAVAERFVGDRTRRVVLAGRDPVALRSAGERLAAAAAPASVEVTVLEFDALDRTSHAAVVDRAFAGGDVDVALIAFGVLGEQERAERDAEHAVEVVTVDFTAAVSVGVPLAQALRAQGHGSLVVLSSVAGERPRRSNFVYGAAKAGLDAFATGLGDALRGSGVHVLVVRPGFVRTRMTAHLPAAPLSTTPEAVATAIVAGVRWRKETIWVPSVLRLVMSVLRHLPRAVFRRLPI
ncbi:decaprenylphospho-beta-D-erythro-pentofuranosid-2-ulose 2-reductase [Blastococcus haudaquaticus]|uniref:Decaprenylphospho-beta-D-erythro-pentofuranosid-2-ulose 2-reductase n=1 Tax=Blastococcus haudaquaticus TaxID=1938745 RepID=A0A286GGA0_9ACTN|nr:decaprenylphospho-beta-D-erythro-pentofuranosid-2-ulose 2-reductase [Blastococcus haudaquaticus]SOD94553.1 decaprenylphospho-beta-D-erythro-pentofuranosid-2-ulose 2-reductase [Blastococcus haudaquaticus]